jgi:ribosome-binding protein aMBF1 (putative translation factor)
MSTPFRELEAASLATMTPDERARFDVALGEEETRLRVAEIAHQTRSTAGLTQAAVAEHVGTKRSAISLVESA